MSRHYLTRAQRAKRLFEMLESGPEDLSEAARRKYRLWVASWVLPVVRDLIPELKGVDLPPVSDLTGQK